MNFINLSILCNTIGTLVTIGLLKTEIIEVRKELALIPVEVKNIINNSPCHQKNAAECESSSEIQSKQRSAYICDKI